jgi:ribonuclease J
LLKTTVLHPIDEPRTIRLKIFEVDFINVSHSLSCSTAIAIRTPLGVLIHSGDFKIDHTPVLGESIDLKALGRYGDAGVLALFSDSTNAEWPGFTPSERAVIPELRRLFEAATGRIILTCFTTSTHRIQIVLDLAQELERRVLLLGRSMIQNIETTSGLRLLDVPDGILVSVAEAKKLPSDQLIMLVAGSQGEPRSAMTRIATDQVKGISVGPGDLVIHSARVIPGKERAISRLISHCYRRGARVVDKSIAPVHVSGHASQEELAIMIRTTKPRFLIPIHGEHRQLYRHKEFAETLNIVDPQNIILFENGDILEFDERNARITGKEVVGRTFIDQSLGEVESMVVRDRRHLSYDGVLVCIVAINPTSGKLDSDPEIVSRGFMDAEEGAETLATLQQVVRSAVERASHEQRIDSAVMQEEIRLALKRFIKKQTGRQPMIMPVILEV